METWDDNWARNAQCKQAGLDAMFVRGAEQNRAKNICAGCPVRMECLAEALDSKLEWGVWGGMTERERRAVLKKRPNVTSWRRLFEAARIEQLSQVEAERRAIRARRAAAERTAAQQVAAGRAAARTTQTVTQTVTQQTATPVSKPVAVPAAPAAPARVRRPAGPQPVLRSHAA